MKQLLLILFTIYCSCIPSVASEQSSSALFATEAQVRGKLNFNGGWRLKVGDFPEAEKPDYDDGRWQQVTLPYAFNGHEAFRKDITDLTDTIAWYRWIMGSVLLITYQGK